MSAGAMPNLGKLQVHWKDRTNAIAESDLTCTRCHAVIKAGTHYYRSEGSVHYAFCNYGENQDHIDD